MFVILNDAPTILEPVKFSFKVRLIRAVKDLRRGNPVILVDDFDRENEADLIVAAERISTEAMAMLIRECSGIVCLCLTEEHASAWSCGRWFQTTRAYSRHL
jgi:3,4-dihydroxy-2-butanone 4-phosphate synthase